MALQLQGFNIKGNKTSNFQPHWWCRNKHFQTLWPLVGRTYPRPSYRREKIRLYDDDFIDLDWLGPKSKNIPIVVVLHGLEGSSQSHYVRTLTNALQIRQVRSCVIHFRGCGGEINKKPRSYHGGETHDPIFIIRNIRRKYPDAPLFAVGYSLGASVLLKLLAELRDESILQSAVAVAVPFELRSTAKKLEQGSSRFYQYWLLKRMKNTVRRKKQLLKNHIDIKKVLCARTFYEFDDAGTAPVHGFHDAKEYYIKASCRKDLLKIKIPVLILNSIDDPVTCEISIPHAKELGPNVVVELCRYGGHIGYVGSTTSHQYGTWLDNKIIEYLNL